MGIIDVGDRMQGTSIVESIAPFVADNIIKAYESGGRQFMQTSLESDRLPNMYAVCQVQSALQQRGFTRDQITVLPYEQNGSGSYTVHLDDFVT